MFYKKTEFLVQNKLLIIYINNETNLFNFTFLQVCQEPDEDLFLLLQVSAEDVRHLRVEVDEDGREAEAVLLLDVPVGALDHLDLFLLQLVVDLLQLIVEQRQVQDQKSANHHLYT